MKSTGRKIGESLATGQALCAIIAFLHMMWRIIQVLIGIRGDWYDGYLISWLAGSMVLFMASLAIACFTLDMYADKAFESDSDIAIIPMALCVLLMATILCSFEYVVLDGLSELGLIHIILGVLVLICYLRAEPVAPLKYWTPTEDDLKQAVTKAISTSLENTPSEW